MVLKLVRFVSKRKSKMASSNIAILIIDMQIPILKPLDKFVNQHPNGYNRIVTEAGKNLSGGQRQAIAIARALLLNPKLLIIDEPCSSMDDASTAFFISQLKAILPGKTLILSTHHSSLLELVDRIIVLDNGRIIADGPKQDVFKKLNKNHTDTPAVETNTSQITNATVATA
jgi:ATP-binding cassette subfamily C protein LapB